MSDTISDLIDRLHREAALERPDADTPDVGIVMGSDSDLETMMTGGKRRGAYDAFVDELGFAEQTDYEDAPAERFTFETYVTSAHRTPDLMTAYAETAEDRGLEVIIAGAGGKSADLPNMTASIAYPLPVIGVPVQEKSVDSVIGMQRARRWSPSTLANPLMRHYPRPDSRSPARTRSGTTGRLPRGASRGRWCRISSTSRRRNTGVSRRELGSSLLEQHVSSGAFLDGQLRCHILPYNKLRRF